MVSAASCVRRDLSMGGGGTDSAIARAFGAVMAGRSAARTRRSLPASVIVEFYLPVVSSDTNSPTLHRAGSPAKGVKEAREEREAKRPQSKRPLNHGHLRLAYSSQSVESTGFSRDPSNKASVSEQQLPFTRRQYWSTSRPKYSNWLGTPARI
ncbi:hypothetical protein ACHAWF_012813 [Thalassiosira exigua]